jgi:hypothetical protein
MFREGRALQLHADERAGKQLKVNWQREQQWADELRARLSRRTEDLSNQERLSALPPRLLGCALVAPAGYFARDTKPADAASRAEVERLAMEVVVSVERALGFEPRDVSAENLGYDVESAIPNSGRLRFIEVKGRNAEAPTVTITKNEILTALNKPDDFILALVPVSLGAEPAVRYLRRPFVKEPDFGATSVNYDFDDLLARAAHPS